MSTSQEKEKLIEAIGIRLETRLSMSPLASRIYALLSLSTYEGLSFDEIRETLGSSKSSISVNINVLMQLKYLEYYTKSGDRKRYFRVAKYFQLSALENYIQSLQEDIELVKNINSYNKLHHPEKFANEESFGDITIDYLEKMQNLVEVSIQKMKNFRTLES